MLKSPKDQGNLREINQLSRLVLPFLILLFRESIEFYLRIELFFRDFNYALISMKKGKKLLFYHRPVI